MWALHVIVRVCPFHFFRVSLNTEDDGSKFQIWSVLANQDQAKTDGYPLPIMSTAIKSMKSLIATDLLNNVYI